MSDNPDSGAAEEEEMTSHLLGLLYPDEADSELADEAEYTDQGELSEFRSLLGHFRDMPEEEPSPAVSNKLLAMAAQHAPATKKKEEEGKGFFSWLSDLLLPTAYHPGLASAASLVLIAGLAGTLYVNGKSQVTEPMVATQAVAPETDRAMGTATLADPSEVPAAALEESSAALAKSAEDPAPAADIAGAADEREFEKSAKKELADDGMAFKAEAKRDRTLDGNVGGLLGEGSAKGKGGGGSGLSDSFDSSIKNRASGSATPGNTKARPKEPSKLGANQPARRKAKPVVTPPTDSPKDAKPKSPRTKAPIAKPTKPAPSPPSPTTSDKAPEPEPAPARVGGESPQPPTGGPTPKENKQKISEERAGDDDDADDAEGEEAVASEPEESKPDPAVEAAAIHKRAIAAAKKNECAKVKSLGQAIRKLSSSYYDRTFLSDKRLTACLAPEVKK